MTDTTQQTPRSSRKIGDTVRLLASYQKSNKGAPAYSRFVNRPFGRVLAAVAYRLGMNPNQVTLVSGTTSLLGIICLATLPAAWTTGVLVTFLLVLGYALDSADGQLARLTGGGSPAGEWLDHVVDCIKISLLHLTVLISLYRFTELDRALLLIPAAYVLVANLYFFAFILGDLLKRTKGVKPARSTQKASVLRSIAVAPTDYGVMCLVFLAWGAPTIFLTAYAILLAGTAGYVALGLPKWFRDMVALAEVPA
ncbi:CDP-alcohol phosphatidyltransferase family protein [Austwickia chelonae]|uniref:CDP-alcohol phosphatidyltransferase family protein n=1 Tax=Austwickia chelonae TaxID=100225 RepID=UPI000E24A8B7|nr:CDP-alcohol phosphatidyltransferase family protein [Austwickia chelonae]